MEGVLAILLVALTVKQLMTFGGIWRSHLFLRRAERSQGRSVTRQPFVAVVIPVLREQKTVEGALRHFSSIPYSRLRLVIVSTEREGPMDLPGSTMDVLKKMSGRYPFTWLHYPNARGTKADQLNYVTERFTDLFPGQSLEDSFIAVYDADSRPNLRTFEHLARLYELHPTVRVFQQSSIFDLSAEKAGFVESLVRLFLKANAVRANRFVFAYEIPRLLNRLAYYRGGPVIARAVGMVTYAHCVGHGIFVRADLARRLPFPPYSVLEDMFYGFLLNYVREPVVPIPILDHAGVPARVPTLFFQMSRWFLGPSRSLSYYRYARQALPERKPGPREWVLILAGWWYSLNWALTTPVVFGNMVSVVLGLRRWWYGGKYLLERDMSFASGAFIIMYLATVAAMLLVHNSALRWAGVHDLGDRIPLGQACCILLIYPLVLLFHSLPAYHCLYNRLLPGHLGIRVGKTEAP